MVIMSEMRMLFCLSYFRRGMQYPFNDLSAENLAQVV